MKKFASGEEGNNDKLKRSDDIISSMTCSTHPPSLLGVTSSMSLVPTILLVSWVPRPTSSMSLVPPILLDFDVRDIDESRHIQK